MVTYPAEKIDFDSSKIPVPITRAFEEAVTCHSTECYTAAALMVRKTLEELCKDRGVTGGNLKERIDKLKTTAILPNELFEGMHDLRLLGNDAAHIELKDFEDVGKEEVEIAIELTKEVLKAVYQFSNLIDRLKALKRQSGISPAS